MSRIIKIENCGECPLLSRVYSSKQGFYYQCDANKRIKKFDKDLLHDKCPLPPNNNEDDLTTAYMYAYQQAKDEFKPRWRKYPEEKPEKIKQNILVRFTDGDYLLLSYDDRYSNFDCYYNDMEGAVTHWMSIPNLED